MIDNADILVNYVRRCNVVTTDSREISKLKNSGKIVMFIALKGDKYDGNNFVGAAIEDGADYVVTDNAALDGNENRKLLVVKDSLKMMQLSALAYRRIVDPKVVAITGTNGKTTTKELVAATLSKKYRTYATKGNLNNHIGVPLTILNMPKTTEVLVVEMGANHPGEIAKLCRIAEPNYGIITNVGRAHLEGFSSFAGVCKAK
ncbi:MAG: Mur ligase family protein, partial [Rikenellaceae bacterium]